MKIFKYKVGQYVPAGAIPIHAGLDANNRPCVWCEVDPTVTEQGAYVCELLTGAKVPDYDNYGGVEHVGTYISSSTRSVIHIYLDYRSEPK